MSWSPAGRKSASAQMHALGKMSPMRCAIANAVKPWKHACAATTNSFVAGCFTKASEQNMVASRNSPPKPTTTNVYGNARSRAAHGTPRATPLSSNPRKMPRTQAPRSQSGWSFQSEANR